jgi:hypothetical protein
VKLNLASVRAPLAPPTPASVPAFEDAEHICTLADRYVSGDPMQRVRAGLATGAVVGATAAVPPLLTLTTGSIVAGAIGSLVPAAAGTGAGLLISRKILKQPGGDPSIWIGFLAWAGGLMAAATCMSVPATIGAAAMMTVAGFAAGLGAARGVDRQARKELAEISRDLDRAIDLQNVLLKSATPAGTVERKPEYVIINGIKVPKGGRA